jgi:hypothetical protein
MTGGDVVGGSRAALRSLLPLRPTGTVRTISRATVLAFALLGGCAGGTDEAVETMEGSGGTSSESRPLPTPASAAGTLSCHARIEAALARPALPGTPAYDEVRAEILGRARGEPMVFVRDPARADDAMLSPAARRARAATARHAPGARIEAMKRLLSQDPRALRQLVLREGYAFSDDPLDALAISRLELRDLFDEPDIVRLRGSTVRRLIASREHGERLYREADGPRKGKRAELVFGDRLAIDEAELGAPLHRDVRALAEETGLDRFAIEHRTESALVGSIRLGNTMARALIENEGASLRLACLDVPDERRIELESWMKNDAPRREALARISAVIDQELDEALRFDRPEGEKTAERDGRLRPAWLDAYRRGSASFTCEDTTLPTFDAEGRPFPPQVCVDFVLDTFERARGTWFTARSEKPTRMRGALDFDRFGMENRRAVLAFEKFAGEHPDVFSLYRFTGEERIPFGDRTRFFRFLVEHADQVRAGDVVAIQGRKRDGLIHQHAIFVERIDPVSGFAYGLADQMKRPRRRTWEGIMAEAPLRSLLFRARPTPVVLGTAGE